jgi:hypothetical protein
MDTWLRIEAGQLDRAAVLAADLIDEAERHGFDMWRLVGVTWRPPSAPWLADGAGDVDPSALAHTRPSPRRPTLCAPGSEDHTTIYDAMLDGC